MAIIRPSNPRIFSKGYKGLYVFPTMVGNKLPCLEWWIDRIHSNHRNNEYEIKHDDPVMLAEDFVEVMLRLLEQAGYKVTFKDVNKIRKSLYLPPLKKDLRRKRKDAYRDPFLETAVATVRLVFDQK